MMEVLSLAQKFPYRSLSILMNFFLKSAVDYSVEGVLVYTWEWEGNMLGACTCPPVHAVGSSNTNLTAAGYLGRAGWTVYLLASFLGVC